MLFTKSIINIYNDELLIIFRSSIIKKRKRINKIRNSYKISVLIINYCDSFLKILIVIVLLIKKLYI